MPVSWFWLTDCQVLSAGFETRNFQVQQMISPAQREFLFRFTQWILEVRGCRPVRIRMFHKGNPTPYPLFSIRHSEVVVKLPCYLGWPRKAMNTKAASSWFNLGNEFLDMVFKHFGNENAHNELSWTLCFLSRLSSWASPRGLAILQTQALHSCSPVRLLTRHQWLLIWCHVFMSF